MGWCCSLINPFWRFAINRFRKTNPSGTPGSDGMDPKPKLDVSNLRTSAGVLAKRRKNVRSPIVYTDAEKKHLAVVLRKLRRRQTRQLGERDEDPSPYNPAYVFYCLTGKPEMST